MIRSESCKRGEGEERGGRDVLGTQFVPKEWKSRYSNRRSQNERENVEGRLHFGKKKEGERRA